MGKVGTAECQSCYQRFPKPEMSKEKRKSGSSGSSFSFGQSGLKGARVHSGRDYYRYVWVCSSCSSACFVATATMGDYKHPTVRELQKFREDYLLHREWGRIFVRVYYKWGPCFASVIENNYWFRKLSYLFIVKPLLFIAVKLKEYN